MFRRQVFLAVLLTLSVALGVSSVHADEAGPVRVSGDSPFASCSSSGSGSLYGNAETEPYVAVNPADPSNIVGAWQQDRWSNGASRGAAAAYSTDGGDSWAEVQLPFTSCVKGGLPYQRASDLWVSFGPDGLAYAIALTLGQSGSSAVVAAASSDGGKTWANAKEVAVDSASPRRFFNDKPSVMADPTTPGVAYIVWTRLESGNGDGEQESQGGGPGAGAYFSKTGDGGKTWSEPKSITDPTAGEATGNQVLVDPRTGVLYDFFDMITQSGRGRLSYSVRFVKSTDGGENWSEPATVSDMRSAPVPVPNSRAGLRAGGIIPSAAIDPISGKLYVVWMDSRFGTGRYPEVAISSSGDDGSTWTPPSRVNTPYGGSAFTPSVAVNSSGTVGVSYFDLRNRKTGTPDLPADYWITFSTNGGASFSGERHLAGPFDILSAPNSGGYFLGDYQGLAASGDAFLAFFVQSNSGDKANPTDVFASVATYYPPALWQVQ